MFTQQQLKKRQVAQNAWQKKYRNAKQATTLCQEDIIFAQGVIKQVMVERDQNRLASAIIQSIHQILIKCLRLKSRKLVMEKVLANPTLQSSLFDFFILKRLAITIQELIAGMCVSM
jgi:hypothetical protein